MSKKKMTYEAAYAELQQILATLQQQEVGLDDLARHLTRARELITYCRERLRAVEEDLEDIFEEE